MSGLIYGIALMIFVGTVDAKADRIATTLVALCKPLHTYLDSVAKAKEWPSVADWRVGVGPIVHDTRKFSSEGSVHLAGRLKPAMEKFLTHVETDTVETAKMLNYIMRTQSPEYDDSNERALGKLKGAQAFIRGVYNTAYEGKLYLRLEILIAFYMEVKSAEDFIPTNVLPNLSFDVEMPTSTVAALEAIENASIEREFGFRAWLTEGEDVTFQDGDSIQVNVWTEKDCHIRVYHKSPKDELRLFFPMDNPKGYFLRTGLHALPGPQDKLWVARPPYGHDMFKIVAVTQTRERETGVRLKSGFTAKNVEQVIRETAQEHSLTSWAHVYFKTASKETGNP